MFDYEKYTPYVLTSYGIAITVLLGLIVWTTLRLARANRKLADAEAAEAEAKGSGQP
jgi:heme exporter protein CcmD